MLSNLLVMMLVFPVTVESAYAAAEAPPVITFPSKQGDILFNHRKHVDGSRNCKTCHDRKGGKIKGLGKEWAHKVCKGCHEAIMVGPITCAGCHSSKPAQ